MVLACSKKKNHDYVRDIKYQDLLVKLGSWTHSSTLYIKLTVVVYLMINVYIYTAEIIHV